MVSDLNNLSIDHPKISELPESIQALMAPPDVAWPTIILAFMATSLYLCAAYCSLIGVIPLWLGVIVVVIASYLNFTPAHDAVHRAVSSRWDWINSAIDVNCFFF
jgi:beta-carotene hydroxylase